MHCPYCDHPDVRVVDSRDAAEGIRRRRECHFCGQRFTTMEQLQAAALLVAKHDGRREPFSREKVHAGVLLAFAKRPVSVEDMDGLVVRGGARVGAPGSRRGPQLSHRRIGDGAAAGPGLGGLRALRQHLPQLPGHRQLCIGGRVAASGPGRARLWRLNGAGPVASPHQRRDFCGAKTAEEPRIEQKSWRRRGFTYYTLRAKGPEHVNKESSW